MGSASHWLSGPNQKLRAPARGQATSGPLHFFAPWQSHTDLIRLVKGLTIWCRIAAGVPSRGLIRRTAVQL